MHLGDLRQQVTLQAELPSADAAGGYALSWQNVATVAASLTPLSGGERYIDAALQAAVTHKVQMRWRGDIAVTAAMRLLCNDRLFNIRAVLNLDERNRWWELLVEEGVAV